MSSNLIGHSCTFILQNSKIACSQLYFWRLHLLSISARFFFPPPICLLQLTRLRGNPWDSSPALKPYGYVKTLRLPSCSQYCVTCFHLPVFSRLASSSTSCMKEASCTFLKFHLLCISPIQLSVRIQSRTRLFCFSRPVAFMKLISLIFSSLQYQPPVSTLVSLPNCALSVCCIFPLQRVRPLSYSIRIIVRRFNSNAFIAASSTIHSLLILLKISLDRIRFP